MKTHIAYSEIWMKCSQYLVQVFFLPPCRCCDAIGSWAGRKKAGSIRREATAREIAKETRVILPAAGREREAIYRKQVDRVKRESSVVDSYGISSTHDTDVWKYVLFWSVMLILSRNNTFNAYMNHILEDSVNLSRGHDQWCVVRCSFL